MAQFVHVEWEGPLALSEIERLGDAHDYGIYQVCGSHLVYGSDALLYIGLADSQPFQARIFQHEWLGEEFGQGEISVYLGRISGSATPKDEEWGELISGAEALLIAAHKPSYNSQRVLGLSPDVDLKVQDLHVLNWGRLGSLLPEVSGARWTKRFADISTYKPFGAHQDEPAA